MSDIQELTKALINFRDARDWAQYHNPKDLAAALSIEASELLECYLWRDAEQAELPRVKEELADVLSYALMLADHYKLDVKQIVLDKMEKNAEKYPVEKAKGKMTKYDKL
jgi:NTP pyrophosphatase (non-canonical NTP hydrolase)